ncbi:MAG: hypothetical protein AAFU59_08000 [Pseudomonadota bacterium]
MKVAIPATDARTGAVPAGRFTPLQELADRSPRVHQLRGLSARGPLQRMTVTINADSVITEAAQHIERSTDADFDIASAALSALKPDETLNIVSHGYHSMTKPVEDLGGMPNLSPMLMGGITPYDLVHMLMERGWPKEHRGTIDLRACMTGADSLLPNFAELFIQALRDAGRANPVVGYQHLSKTTGDGEEEAQKTTVSKMMAMASSLDPSDDAAVAYAEQACVLFESRDPTLAPQRALYDKTAKSGPTLAIGLPAEGSPTSREEWMVYSQYHAIRSRNMDVLNAVRRETADRMALMEKPPSRDHRVAFPVDAVLRGGVGAHAQALDLARIAVKYRENPSGSGKSSADAMGLDDLMAMFANLPAMGGGEEKQAKSEEIDLDSMFGDEELDVEAMFAGVQVPGSENPVPNTEKTLEDELDDLMGEDDGSLPDYLRDFNTGTGSGGDASTGGTG